MIKQLLSALVLSAVALASSAGNIPDPLRIATEGAYPRSMVLMQTANSLGLMSISRWLSVKR